MSIYFPIALMLLSGTSMKAAQVLIALYALNLGAQPFAVGVLAATYSVFPMFLSWPVGKLADRFGSRWPLMLGAACGVCGMLVPYYVPGLPALYIASAMYGLTHAFSNVCLQNLVGLMSSPENRAKNYSNYSLATSVAVFIGPMASGFSIDYSGYDMACLNVALISFLPAILLLIWGGALPKGSGHSRHGGKISDLLTESGLWRVLVTCCLMTSGVDLFQFYMPIYGHEIGLSASAIGVILATFAVSAFIVRLIIPYLVKRFSAEVVLIWAFFLGAGSLVLVPFFKGAVALVLISFVFGLGAGTGQPITLMQTFSNSVKGRSGEAMGLRVTANQLTRVVVPIVFGSIVSMFGLFAVFWGNAILLASGGVVTKPNRAERTRTACSD
jgi:predicted MFS family arabinose efflux permease